MRILGIDMSTKTGYAVMDDGKLGEFGLIKVPEFPPEDNLCEDFFFLDRADYLAMELGHLIDRVKPDYIYIEQTNMGRARGSQKQLEFLHAMFLFTVCRYGDFLPSKVNYVDTSRWRQVLEIKLTKDQRAHNKTVKSGKSKGKITSKHLAVQYVNEKYGVNFLIKQNDEADAVCLAEYGTRHAQKKKVITANIDEVFRL